MSHQTRRFFSLDRHNGCSIPLSVRYWQDIPLTNDSPFKMIIAFVYKNLEVSNGQAIALALTAITSLILLVVALANTAKK